VHPTAGRRERGAGAAQKLARTQAAKAGLNLHFFIAVSLLRPATCRTMPRRWYMMAAENKKKKDIGCVYFLKKKKYCANKRFPLY
jgi:hypothetical protein